MSAISGIFIHRGFNYKTGKYDIGHNDNKNCVDLKELFNRRGIKEYSVIKNQCPAYFETFDNLTKLESNFVDTRYTENEIIHETDDFSISKSLYSNKPATITNKNPNESYIIIKHPLGIPIHHHDIKIDNKK